MKVTVDDVRNPLEARLLKEILSFQRSTKYEKLEYESHSIPYYISRPYVPDFIITRSDGSILYIEVKGYFRRDDEEKLLAVKRTNPEIDLRIVFDKNNKCVGRKMRYSDWCAKHGFHFAIGSIPKEWLRA